MVTYKANGYQNAISFLISAALSLERCTTTCLVTLMVGAENSISLLPLTLDPIQPSESLLLEVKQLEI